MGRALKLGPSWHGPNLCGPSWHWPSCFWAEGRVLCGPSWHGPSWFWAELYCTHSALIVKYNIKLKIILQQDMSPVFNGD